MDSTQNIISSKEGVINVIKTTNTRVPQNLSSLLLIQWVTKKNNLMRSIMCACLIYSGTGNAGRNSFSETSGYYTIFSDYCRPKASASIFRIGYFIFQSGKIVRTWNSWYSKYVHWYAIPVLRVVSRGFKRVCLLAGFVDFNRGRHWDRKAKNN